MPAYYTTHSFLVGWQEDIMFTLVFPLCVDATSPEPKHFGGSYSSKKLEGSL